VGRCHQPPECGLDSERSSHPDPEPDRHTDRPANRHTGGQTRTALPIDTAHRDTGARANTVITADRSADPDVVADWAGRDADAH
jgi:hypothetical protein